MGDISKKEAANKVVDAASGHIGIIRLNTISPEIVDTAMPAKDDHEALKSSILIRRLVQFPKLRMLCCICSLRQLVKGENIRIDGGAHAGAK